MEIRCSNTSQRLSTTKTTLWVSSLLNSATLHSSPEGNETSSSRHSAETLWPVGRQGHLQLQLPGGSGLEWASNNPATVSRVGTASPPTDQRNPEPGFSSFVMFIEVQPEAEKPETFIRAGRQQHQKLLHNTLGWKRRRVSWNTLSSRPSQCHCTNKPLAGIPQLVSLPSVRQAKHTFCAGAPGHLTSPLHSRHRNKQSHRC